MAGACFGIPIALLVIQALSASQLEVVARRSAMRQSLRTLLDFAESTRRLLKKDSRDQPTVMHMADRIRVFQTGFLGRR
jgi:hypothetical protein